SADQRPVRQRRGLRQRQYHPGYLGCAGPLLLLRRDPEVLSKAVVLHGNGGLRPAVSFLGGYNWPLHLRPRNAMPAETGSAANPAAAALPPLLREAVAAHQAGELDRALPLYQRFL